MAVAPPPAVVEGDTPEATPAAACVDTAGEPDLPIAGACPPAAARLYLGSAGTQLTRPAITITHSGAPGHS